MVVSIQSLQGSLNSVSHGTHSSAKQVGQSFQTMLSNALDSVGQAQTDANNQVNQLVNGTASDLHNVTIALEKSDLMLKLAVNVRDKVVSAYQDVMRMQI